MRFTQTAQEWMRQQGIEIEKRAQTEKLDKIAGT
jgi:hypothetical protein